MDTIFLWGVSWSKGLMAKFCCKILLQRIPESRLTQLLITNTHFSFPWDVKTLNLMLYKIWVYALCLKFIVIRSMNIIMVVTCHCHITHSVVYSQDLYKYWNTSQYVRFEVLIVMSIKIMVKSCSSIDEYHCFRVLCCIHCLYNIEW
jgi:hypothetical protein